VSDDAAAAGMRRQLAHRTELLAGGAEPLGWKVGFNVPALQDKLGIAGPVAGFLSTAGLIEDGGRFPTAGGSFVAEPEVAVEIGPDGRAIVALLPAIEVAATPDLDLGIEAIVAGNVFHRAVAFGPRVETGAPGAARVLVNGEETEAVPAERTGAALTAMVEAVAARLEEAGEELRPGECIITGVIAPPPSVSAGDRVRLEFEALGAVEVGFD